MMQQYALQLSNLTSPPNRRALSQMICLILFDNNRQHQGKQPNPHPTEDWLPNVRPAAACQLSSVPEIRQGNAVIAVGGSWRRTQGPLERMLCTASESLHSTGQLPQLQDAEAISKFMPCTFLPVPQDHKDGSLALFMSSFGLPCMPCAGVASQKRLTPRRWQSLVVVTNSFHQLRSFLTFQCAVRQSQPRHRQMKACSMAVAL